MLNVLQIEQVEAFPDTTITLLSGNKIVVKDDIQDVFDAINDRYKAIGLTAGYKDVEGS